MNTNSLPQQLIKNIITEIQQSTPKVYWQKDFALSEKMINLLLETPQGISELEQILRTKSPRYYYQQAKKEYIISILQKYEEQIGAEIFFENIIKEYDLENHCQEADTNFEQLFKNYNHKIALHLNLFHPPIKKRETIQEEDIKEVADLFNINPNKIHHRLTEMSNRNGNEFISPYRLTEMWTHVGASEYIVPLDMNLLHYIQNAAAYHTGITLLKNSKIILYNKAKGYISSAAILQKDLTILKANLPYNFKEIKDNRSITACYNQHLWTGKITISKP